jgi:hypothetical protein
MALEQLKIVIVSRSVTAENPIPIFYQALEICFGNMQVTTGQKIHDYLVFIFKSWIQVSMLIRLSFLKVVKKQSMKSQHT